MRARLAAPLALLLLSAGCAGSGPVAPSREALAPENEVTDLDAAESGEILGYVLNDERVPIPNATVVLSALRVEALSAEDGGFRFAKVPRGKQSVEAHAPGYSSSSRAIEVLPEVPARVELVLDPLQVQSPHFVIHEHRATMTGAGLAGGSCVGCRWSTPFTGAPDYVLIEVLGKHAVSNPAHRDAVAISLGKVIDHGGRHLNGTAFHDCRPDAANAANKCGDVPLRLVLDGSQIEQAHPKGKPAIGLWIAVACDPRWACVEETYDVYVTAFYWWRPAAVADTFSATQPGTGECVDGTCTRSETAAGERQTVRGAPPAFPRGHAQPLRLVPSNGPTAPDGHASVNLAAAALLTAAGFVAAYWSWRQRAPRTSRLLARARAAFGAKDLPRAERLAREATRADPASADAWFLYGSILVSRGEHRRCARELEAAMKGLGCQMSGLAFVLSLAYDRTGEPEKAAALLPVVAREKTLWTRLHRETGYRILLPTRPARAADVAPDPSYA